MKWKTAFAALSIAVLISAFAVDAFADSSVSYVSCSGPCVPTVQMYVDRSFNADYVAHPRWIEKTVFMDGHTEFRVLGNVVRRETGPDPLHVATFAATERVSGAFIGLDDGRLFESCWMDAPTSGTASVGVVNPSPAEISNVAQCDLSHPSMVRVSTGNVGTVSFSAGSRIMGAKIVLDKPDGRTFSNCKLNWTSVGGTVTGGIIDPFPWQSDYLALPNCT